MLIMKFVYNFANMNDVDALYKKIQKVDLKIPLKDLNQFKESVHLGQPLAISNYLKGLDQFERLPTNFKNQHWDVKSTLGSKYVFFSFNRVVHLTFIDFKSIDAQFAVALKMITSTLQRWSFCQLQSNGESIDRFHTDHDRHGSLFNLQCTFAIRCLCRRKCV